MEHTSQNPQSPEPALEHSDMRFKPDGVMDPAGEAGWFLQRERELRGLSLEQAGADVGIHPYHIEAIEYGDMTHMPSRAEALEMIAAYANFLGFEPEPLLQHYLTFLPLPQVAPRHHPASPAPLSSAKILKFGKFVKLPSINIRLPSMPGGNNGIVASVAAAFVLFSGITWMAVPGGAPQPALEQVAEISDPMPTASTGSEAADVKITEAPMDDEALAAVEQEAEPVDATAPILDPDVMGAFIQDNVEGSSEVTIVPDEKLVATKTEGRSFGSPDKDVRIVLKAARSIWLLIEDGKGNRVATQLLNKGDIYRVPNREGLVATVQDGGAIKYMIDGVEMGVLGQPGAVLAAEPLDLAKLAAKG